MAVLMALFLVALMIGTIYPIASNPHILPDMISAHGGVIDRQIYLTLWITGVIMVLAHIGLILAVLKFKAKEGRKVQYFHGNNAFEITTVVLSLILFVGLNIMGQGVWAEMHLNEKPKDAVQIEVMGMQFKWYFRYPGRDKKFDSLSVHAAKETEGEGNFFGIEDYDETDDITKATITIPLDTDVVVRLRSRDVLHSFNVRELRIKQDTVPGLEIEIPFKAMKEKTLKFTLDPGALVAKLDAGELSPELKKAFGDQQVAQKEHTFALYEGAAVKVEKAGSQWLISSGSKKDSRGQDKPVYIKHRIMLENGKLNVYRANYEVVCTELCGLGHYTMRGQIDLLPKADYDAWYEKEMKAME